MSDEHLLGERLLAERAERRRIAERLHDGPVQHVAALSQMLDAAAPGARGGRRDGGRAPIATRALEVARDAAEELRGIVSGLEPVALEETVSPRPCGSWPSAPRGAAAPRSRSTSTRPALGEGARSSLFQVIREALDQAVRRGPPERDRDHARRTPTGGVELVVVGRRRARAPPGGARRPRERAAELNGTFDASRADDRTTIRVVLPPSAARI